MVRNDQDRSCFVFLKVSAKNVLVNYRNAAGSTGALPSNEHSDGLDGCRNQEKPTAQTSGRLISC
jgi:hypothetical protein